VPPFQDQEPMGNRVVDSDRPSATCPVVLGEAHRLATGPHACGGVSASEPTTSIDTTYLNPLPAC
jgi:hypothetical protein